MEPQITTKGNYDTRLQIEVMPGTAFYASLMAAYYQADTYNKARLEELWPQACLEFRARYYAPNGCLSLHEWLEGQGADIRENKKIRAHIRELIDQAWRKAKVPGADALTYRA